MTPCERLEAMLGRSEKATPGPWFVLTSRDVFPAVIVPGKATIACDFINETDADFAAASRTDLPATAKCLLAALGPLERCRDKLIELRDSERMLGASAYEKALIQYRIDEATVALDIINRELSK